jgi:uncharacterized protein (DUF58 family)
MTMSAAELNALWIEARASAAGATRIAHLPLRRRAWRGPTGAWQGAGIGNSLEFEDHRPYAPGDDLRHLDWKAFARTDQLVMKLHRHEASPQVDLALDISASQFAHGAKARRTLELAAFVMESALESRAVLRLWAVGAKVEPWETMSALGGRLPANLPARTTGDGPSLDRVPWRRDALRVFVSDLLFPVVAAPLLGGLGGGRGAGLILAPWSREEADPDWEGRLEMEDVETGAKREQRVDGSLLARYRTAYARHFEAWRDSCRRYGVGLARITAEAGLSTAIADGALRDGLLDWAA